MSTPKNPRPRDSERRLRHNFRLARLLQFLELISGPGKWNPKSLTHELEISERTLYRLRETLELAGVPLFFSKEENAYRVRADYRFPPLNLTDEETIDQASATVLSESEAIHLPRGSKATTRKLAATNPKRVQTILDDVGRLTEVLDLKIADHPRQRETIRTVQSALVSRQILTGMYRSPYETGPVRLKLHPYRLALIKQAWYLVARPDAEDRPRTFRIVRFGSLKVSNQAATIPDDFDLKAYLGNAWSIYRGDTTYDVELLFAREVADVVLETTWHQTQKATKHTNGSDTHALVHANYYPNLPLAETPAAALFWEPLDPARCWPHYSRKTFVVGHTPQTTGRILDLGFVICIDTDCSRGNWLTGLGLDTGHYWQANERAELREGTLDRRTQSHDHEEPGCR